MHTRIKRKLKELNIESNSELGKALVKLDEVYFELEQINKLIEFYVDKKQQLEEDAEVMELVLMHKMNKDDRVSKW